MTAPVIRISDLRAARAGRVDTRTETERLIDEAEARGYRNGMLEGSQTGFRNGMSAALEAMHAPAPTMLQPRSLSLVQMGGWAS